MKTRILAINPAKWLNMVTPTTKLINSIRLARSFCSCFIKNAPRFARAQESSHQLNLYKKSNNELKLQLFDLQQQLQQQQQQQQVQLSAPPQQYRSQSQSSIISVSSELTPPRDSRRSSMPTPTSGKTSFVTRSPLLSSMKQNMLDSFMTCTATTPTSSPHQQQQQQQQYHHQQQQQQHWQQNSNNNNHKLWSDARTSTESTKSVTTNGDSSPSPSDTRTRKFYKPEVGEI